jgi:signal transduction histidine kinase
MSPRALGRTIAAVAAAHVGVVLLVWGVMSWPSAGSRPATPDTARPGAFRVVVALALAALAAIPVGAGLVKLGGGAGAAGKGVVTDPRRIRNLGQARGVIAHWMRETDLVRAQFAGQREEAQRLRLEVTQSARHLTQAAAESEQLLTERAHWLAERELLSAELTDRDRELEGARAALEDRTSDADGVRLLLETEIAELRDEVRHAHAALAGHPTVCREFLERELRQHQHRAVAYISHAIRGSLTSVLGFSKLLLRDDDRPLTEDQRASAQHIHEAGAHLLRVVNDLSDLTQVEAGMVELRDELVDMTSVLRVVATTGPAVLARDPATITVVAPPDLPPVRGNTRRLVQLLLTLMQSSARHHADGPVDVSARADDEAVTLVVTHHGASLSAQDLPALFDPFSPIDATSTLQDDGRRLRLALARALATTIGGSIEVDGEASAGTTFTVRVPVAADVSATA